MDKVVKVEERLVPQKFVELPVSYAAELFARSCRECFFCTLADQHSSYSKGLCPFNNKECGDINPEDWRNYFNA